jgi:hypothetical protein
MKFPYKFLKADQLELLKAENKKLTGIHASATTFIREIENGNLDVTIHSENVDVDGLTQALLAMQKQLLKIAEEEKERNWATHGLAMFADLLRSDNSDVNVFYQKIVSNLVKYLNANQGGLFLVDEQDTTQLSIELVACYAYNKQKYINKKVASGEGLVGQCYLEKQTILLTDVPQSYINITSGLGTATPGCLVIVPLKVNDEVHGIVELASFEKFKPYQVEFIERLGESIASTISTVKVNEKTKALLHESQQQAEELRSQEEEMRQNIEELAATQENQSRLQEELKMNEEALKKQLEELVETRAEMDRIRNIEQDRANERIEAQKKTTEKLVQKFKDNELSLKNQVAALQEELKTLKVYK